LEINHLGQCVLLWLCIVGFEGVFVLMKMGLGGENGKVIESLDVCKSKGWKKKKKQDGVMEDEETETGCWLSFRFIGSCISSRSKVDSSVSGTSTNYGNFFFV